MNKYFAIDLFSGCGGLSEGLRTAGFEVLAAFDNDADAIEAYKLDHTTIKVFAGDIRNYKTFEIESLLKGNPLHLLAGCPHVRGFPQYGA